MLLIVFPSCMLNDTLLSCQCVCESGISNQLNTLFYWQAGYSSSQRLLFNLNMRSQDLYPNFSLGKCNRHLSYQFNLNFQIIYKWKVICQIVGTVHVFVLLCSLQSRQWVAATQSRILMQGSLQVVINGVYYSAGSGSSSKSWRIMQWEWRKIRLFVSVYVVGLLLV